MENKLVLVLLILILAVRICKAEISVAPWQPIVRTQLTTNVVHRTPGSLYHYNLHEEDPDSRSSQQTQQLTASHNVNRDQCTLYKIIFNQQLYFEYIHYKIDLPELHEFTLCMWKKFTNHTNDHPLFSYAVDGQPRSILSWIANTQRSSYYMMNVNGHNLYRLNYPLRLNRWYHSCQSWNGRTGEWQIWVNDERVGRGFNNRLVHHVIKGGGTAISGQEQQQIGGGFIEDQGRPGSGGMLGELTMVQLYAVALTAGKAHRDHKHHHAHHFEHNTNNNVPISTTTQAPVTGPPLPMNPFLTGGQLNHQVKINPGAHIQILQNGVTLRHPSLPPPSEAPQPLPPIIPTVLSTLAPHPLSAVLPYNYPKALMGINDGSSSFLPTPVNQPPINGYSFVDRRYRNVLTANVNTLSNEGNERHSQQLHNGDTVQRLVQNIELKKIVKRESQVKDSEHDKVSFTAAETMPETARNNESALSTSSSSDKKKMKRELVFPESAAADDSYIHQVPQLLTDESYFTNGLASFGIGPSMSHKEGKVDEREPAENEVRRVMDVCDGCVDEPFKKALVMSWRSVPKKLYSGALHVPANQACKAF